MRQAKFLFPLIITSLFLAFYLFCTTPTPPDPNAFKTPLIDNNGKIFCPPDSTLIMGEKYYLYIKMKKGLEPFIYKWEKDGSIIDSTSKDTLKMTLSKSSAGSYRVKVSNGFGKDSSAFYTIKDTALFSPKLLDNGIIQKTGKCMLDSNLTFSVRARGADTLRFQWYRRTGHTDSALAGKTDSLLKFLQVTLNDNGYYYVKCWNNWGTQTSKTDSIKVKDLDTTKPSIDLLFPVNTSILSDSLVPVKVKVKDASGISLVTIKGDTITSPDSVYTKQVKLSLGKNTFTIKAVDNSKNKNVDTFSATLTYDPTAIDNVPPVIALLSPSDQDTVSDSIIQVITKVTDRSGISLVTVKGDTAKSQDSIYKVRIKLSKGKNVFYVKATDNSQNKNTDSLGVTLTYNPAAEDNQPPFIDLVSPANNSVVTDSIIQVKAKVTDKSGVNLVTINNEAVTSTDSIYTKQVKLVKGPNSFFIRAFDNSAKKNKDSLKVTITYDSTSDDNVPPIIELITPVNNSAIGDSLVQVKAKIKDKSGISQVTIKGETVTSTDSIYTKLVTLIKGANTLFIKAVDNSVKKNKDSLRVNITYDPTIKDTIKPEISLISPPNNSTLPDSTVQIRVKVKDASGISQVTIKGDVVTSSDSIYIKQIVLVKGSNSFFIKATDNCSNKNKDSLEVRLTYDPTMIDTIGPQITPVSPLNGGVVKNSPIPVTVQVVDISGVAWVRINGDSVKTIVNDNYTKPGVSLTKGSNTVVVIAQDKSANKNLDTFNLRVIYDSDTIIPAITFISPAKDTSVKANVTALPIQIQATDASGIAKVTMNGDSVPGTNNLYVKSVTLQPGKNPVIVTATDNSANKNKALDTLTMNVNRKPLFRDSFPMASYMVKEQDSLLFQVRATDADNDPVVFGLGATNLPGSPPTLNNGNFKWKSSLQDSGSYYVVIYAIDSLDTTLYRVYVAVGNVNIPPRISITGTNNGQSISFTNGTTIQVKEATQLKCTVSVYDANSDDKVYIVSPINTPSSSLFDTAGGKGRFAYTPAFTVSDGNSNTTFSNLTFYAQDNGNPVAKDSFKITITVIDSNSAPYWNQTSATVNAKEGAAVTFQFGQPVFGGDHENDLVTFSAPYGGTITGTSWTWTPGFNVATISSPKDTNFIIRAADTHVPQQALADFRLKVSVADSIVPVTLGNPFNITYDGFSLSWSESPDPNFSSYKIFYGTSPGINETNPCSTVVSKSTTQKIFTGLIDTTKYYVKLYVYNANGSKAYTEEKNATTLKFHLPLLTISQPTLVNNQAIITENSLAVSGTASGTAGIQSVTATVNGGAVTVSGTTSWSFSIPGTVTSMKRWNSVSVIATDSKNNTDTKAFSLFLKPTLTTPAAPTATALTSKKVDLKWRSTQYCDSFRVFRAPTATGPLQAISGYLADTTYSDGTVAMNTDYWYAVKGYYKISGTSEWDSTSLSGRLNVKTKVTFNKQFQNFSFMSIDKIIEDNNGYLVIGQNRGIWRPIAFKVNILGDSVYCLVNSSSRIFFDGVYSSSDNAYFIALDGGTEYGKLVRLGMTGTVENTFDLYNTPCKLEKAQTCVINGNNAFVGGYSVDISTSLYQPTIWKGTKGGTYTGVTYITPGEMNNKNGQFDHVIYNMKNGGYIYIGHTSDGAGVEDIIIVCKCNANNDRVTYKFIPCGGAAVSGSYFAHVTQLKDSTIVVAATLGTNAYYEIINPDDLTKIRSFTTTSKSVFDIAATPDGKFVALENSNQVYSLVQYSSTGTPTALRTFSGTGNTTGALCVTSDQGICVALFLDFLPYVIKMNADGSIDK